MKIEVLASVMNSSVKDITAQMNLDSDAVIINQCGCMAQEEVEYRGHRVRFFSFPERGIGRSRNEAILRAEGDICLFADEDIVYEEGYAEAVLREFAGNPKADMILFNITVEKERRTYHITERKRVHWYNCGRYGAVSFAVKRSSLLKSGITFSLLFGGGAKYSNGEDSLFLKEFMHKGYRVYTAPVTIGRECAGGSTWFEGYNEKFFYDRGVLYDCLYGKAARILAWRFLLAHKKVLCREVSFKQAYGWMAKGIQASKEI
ncbi:MAG: glycosyltransferase family 2 protein [Lachnoclostridium sp.]|nr:glycosyltransferase family 2 protein [Lachnospira sp.]MCM1248757.1 glycosyltransferase family 2 protein [Lachnoclostridium sp.]MCM1535691.1 glycosyltransferase family 2 protein [Clostridium sp.]